MAALAFAVDDPPPYYFPEPHYQSDDELIPPYSNDISIAACLPRKLEFTRTGVVSKDRTWRRVWCAIDGTCLKIYKDSRPFAGLFRQPAAPKRHSPPSHPDFASLDYDSSPSQSDLEKKLSPSSAPCLHALVRSPSHSSASSGESARSEPVPPQRFFDPTALIRQYTLQNARCGLATGYDKRAHVIRIRAEGEQFLLQLESIQQVIQWVETIHAAVNISLDLDERPMPGGPSYPRHPRDH